jgi:hypothetical protein
MTLTNTPPHDHEMASQRGTTARPLRRPHIVSKSPLSDPQAAASPSRSLH